MNTFWCTAVLVALVTTAFGFQDAPSASLLAQVRSGVADALRAKGYGDIDNITVEVQASVPVPIHDSYHRGRADSSSQAPGPDAFIRTIVRESNVFQQPALVFLARGTAGALLSYSGTPGTGGFLPLEEEEWREVARALEPFYAAAVDITRGPERFHRFLPAEMREMLRHAQRKMRLFLPRAAVDELPEKELRRFVALAFDTHTVQAWAAFEGVQHRVRERPRNQMIDENPGAFMASVERALAEARVALRDIGALDARHMDLCAAYMRHLVGEGVVAREDPMRDPVRLPSGARMYSALLGAPGGVYVHFVIEKGTVQIVAVDML